MNSTGLTTQLLFTGFIVWALGFLLIRKYIGNVLGAFIFAIKVAIPIVYFAFYFDDGWLFLDDITYFQKGNAIIARGINPFFALFDTYELDQIYSEVGGSHIFYVMFNSMAQTIIEEHYYAPVLLNVLLTAWSARLLYGLAECSGFSRSYCRALMLLFLVHWDVIAWSSFVNLKDIFVVHFTLAILYLIVKISQRFRARELVLMLLCGAIFSTLRFYIPVLIACSVALWLVFSLRNRMKFALLPLVVLTMWMIVPKGVGYEQWSLISSDSVFHGAVRYLLTPRPWATQIDYSFLLIPCWLHWLFFIPTLLGLLSLWRYSNTTKLIVLYFLVVVCFYAFVPELQGVRQRVQIVFIFCWAQWHFVSGIFLGQNSITTEDTET